MNQILDELLTLFQAQLTGRGITTFFKGKQQIPAQSDLPMLCIYGTETRQTRSGTVRDDAEYDITLELYVSIKQYFDNTAGQGTQIDAYDALLDIVEERESDGDAKTNTIVYVLNNNLTVAGKVLYTKDIRAEYDPYLTAVEFPVARAIVTFTAFDRPNRI